MARARRCASGDLELAAFGGHRSRSAQRQARHRRVAVRRRGDLRHSRAAVATARRRHRARLDVGRQARRAPALGRRVGEPRRRCGSTAGPRRRRSRRTTRGARSAVELTGAGATGEWRQRRRHLGVDLTFLRPERSLRLAAALPPEWLCTTRAQPGDVEGGVQRRRLRGPRATGRRALRASRLGRRCGRRRSAHHTASIDRVDSSGYVRGELSFGHGGSLAGASGGCASFVQWMAGRARRGLRTPLIGSMRPIRYRPELIELHREHRPESNYTRSWRTGTTRCPRCSISAVSMVGTTGAERERSRCSRIVAWRPLP